MQTPLVSIIVLNWNGKHLLPPCLDSLRKLTYPELEILVVDNGSTDGSCKFLKERYPEVHVLANDKNLGFAGGNNVGLRAARGEYIFMLNNDAWLDPNCISELVRAAGTSPSNVGAWATQCFSADHPTVLDHAGLRVYADGLGKGRGRLEEADGRFAEPTEVFFISDSAGMYRKTMLDEIGLYDEDFFLHCEEMDLGFRAHLAGWKTRYVPSAKAYHQYSMTLGKYSPMKAFYTERNRIWTVAKNFPWPMIFLNPFYALARYFYQAFGVFSGRGAAGRFAEQQSKWMLIGILIRAYAAGLAGIPRMLVKRRSIQSRRKISTRDFWNIFKQHGMSAREIALAD